MGERAVIRRNVADALSLTAGRMTAALPVDFSVRGKPSFKPAEI